MASNRALVLGTTSDLFRAVMAPNVDMPTLAESVPIEQAKQAMDLARLGAKPLAEVEIDLQGSMSRAFLNAVADIGLKIKPDMDAETGQKWRVAMLKAISNLPGKVATQAAQKAMHRPMRFLNEVEGAIREEAEDLLSRQNIAILRLERLMAEINRPKVPRLTDRMDEGPIKPEEIRAMPEHIRSLGLSQGWITQRQIDEALAA